MQQPHIRENNHSDIWFDQGRDVDSGLPVAAGSKVLVGFTVAGSGLARFRAALVFAADQQGGNRVLEDELLLRFGFQHDGILIK